MSSNEQYGVRHKSEQTENTIQTLKKDEGFRRRMYKCTAGKWTIGYGLNLEEGITEAEAEVLLFMRVNRLWDELLRRVEGFESMPPEIQGILVEMAYQMGIHGVLGFRRTLRYLRQGRYDDAADEMLDSEWFREDTPSRAMRASNRVRNFGHDLVARAQK